MIQKIARRSFLALLATLFVLAGTSRVARAQSSAWASTFANIKQMYYARHQPKAAMQKLEEELESKGNTYSSSVLAEMLDMMEDYFGKTNETARFEKMIYTMLEPGRVDRIVDHFRGSSLYNPASEAKKKWLAPAAATVRVDVPELDIGDSTTFSITATNQKKAPLTNPAVDVALSPDGLARIEGNTIVAEAPGSVTLSVLGPEGKELAQATITVKEGLKVTITPDYKELKKGEVETFTVESNKTFDKFPIEVHVQPAEVVTSTEVSSSGDGNKKVLRVTAEKDGTGTISVTGPTGAEVGRATIYVPPQPPSRKRLMIGAGVTVVAAVVSIALQSSANGKWSDYESCVNTPGSDPAECNSMYDDYKSAQGTATVFWVVTAVSAVGTGYLWYDYRGDKKTYQEKLSAGATPVSLRFKRGETQVLFSWRF